MDHMTDEETRELRRAHLLAALAETRTVWQKAVREADAWQGILDRALSLTERIEAELNALNVSLPDERSEGVGEDTPVTPAGFLADLSVFAAWQREPLSLTYKPMPY